MDASFLSQITIIFALSIAVVFICNHFKIPAIVGFLLTGVLAGPHGMGFVKAVHQIDMLADVGIVLLLFTTGMEFSFRNLLELRKPAVLGGFLQVSLTAVAVILVMKSLGQPTPLAILMGLLICHTSTPIILKLLQARDELNSPHGRASLGILLFQDISSVPMMLMIPMIAGSDASTSWGHGLLMLALKSLGIVVLIYISAVWIAPKLLYRVARTRSYELFLITIVAICFAVTWLAAGVGLSLALGALFAGIIISESEYSYQALGNILPFRDVFSSFFFVSIGMLLDMRVVMNAPTTILLLASATLVVKAVLAGVSILLIGLPLRSAIFSGVLLCQVGEFSFILAKYALPYGVLTPHIYQIFLAVVVVTMIVEPFLMLLTPGFVDFVLKLPMSPQQKEAAHLSHEAKGKDKPHQLIIIGFGLNGRNVAKASRLAGIPYVILELNAETVKNEKAKGEPIYFGDATQEAVLHKIGIYESRVICIGVTDPIATRIIIQVVHRLNPNLHIIARTRFFHETKLLYDLGANEVIPEELETSVEIFTRVLRKYLIPQNEIAQFIAEIRADNYQILRSQTRDARFFSDLQNYFSQLEINTFRLEPKSPLAGQSLSESNLRKQHGVTVLAIQRGTELFSGPGGDTQLLPQDVVIVMGQPQQMAKASGLFQNPVIEGV